MTNSKTDVLVKYFLHGPDDIAQSYVQWAHDLQDKTGITYGCVLDNHVTPLRPGNMMGVLARPGHGKSSLMACWLRREAQEIIKREAVERECTIFVGWDQLAEETEAFFQAVRGYSATDLAWGRADMSAVIANSISRASLPIFHIGYSIRHQGQRRPPAPTLDNVYDIIQYIEYELKLHPTLIVLDYIQKIPVRRGLARRDEVTEATYRTKELLSRIGSAGLVGVQASRSTDGKKLPIPDMSEAQWASAIEQEADKLISLCRPRKVFSPHDEPTIEVNGVQYDNTDELLLIKNLKQRFESGYGLFPVRFDMASLTINDYQKPVVYDLNRSNGRLKKEEEPIPF